MKSCWAALGDRVKASKLDSAPRASRTVPSSARAAGANTAHAISATRRTRRDTNRCGRHGVPVSEVPSAVDERPSRVAPDQRRGADRVPPRARRPAPQPRARDRHHGRPRRHHVRGLDLAARALQGDGQHRPALQRRHRRQRQRRLDHARPQHDRRAADHRQRARRRGRAGARRDGRDAARKGRLERRPERQPDLRHRARRRRRAGGEDRQLGRLHVRGRAGRDHAPPVRARARRPPTGARQPARRGRSQPAGAGAARADLATRREHRHRRHRPRGRAAAPSRPTSRTRRGRCATPRSASCSGCSSACSWRSRATGWCRACRARASCRACSRCPCSSQSRTCRRGAAAGCGCCRGSSTRPTRRSPPRSASRSRPPTARTSWW